MIQNLDVFFWNRKVGTLVAYKERYTEKVCFYFDSDAQIAGGDGYWSHQIKEEINDRIEILSEVSRQNGFHR